MDWEISVVGQCLEGTACISRTGSSRSFTRGGSTSRQNARTRDAYVRAGCEPFRPNASQTLRSYYEVPAGVWRITRRLGSGRRKPLLLTHDLQPFRPTTLNVAPARRLDGGAILAEADATRPALVAWQNELLERIAQPRFENAHWGIKVVSLDSGRTLFERNAKKYFQPASNAKLFTAALVLDRLGPEYRIRTTVTASTPPDAAWSDRR